MQSGPATVRFDTGTFLGISVPLGELRVDKDGRLVVLGGFGQSASTNGDPIGADPADDDYWSDNDYWHDDISDGPITATVTLPSGVQVAIEQPQDSAWVIVAPPKYALGIYPIVSLYDVMREVALNKQWIPDKQDVTYYGDIFPILSRVVGHSWVSQEAQRGHGYGKVGEFRPPQDLSVQTDGQSREGSATTRRKMMPGETPLRGAGRSRATDSNRLAAPDDEGMRLRICAKIRNPLLQGDAAKRQASARFVPLLSGDGGDRTEGDPQTWMSILPSQYQKFLAWRDGNFTSGEKPTYPPLESIPDPEVQTDALQRGALDPCVGSPLYPGIEASWTVREPDLYVDAFRIDSSKHHAGDITKDMSLPWQADFTRATILGGLRHARIRSSRTMSSRKPTANGVRTKTI